MMSNAVVACLCACFMNCVFDCQADEVKSVTEGDSVSLNTGVTEVQNGDLMQWKLKHTRIAEIIKRDPLQLIFVSNEGIFRDKLHMDNQTGSLTIRNITPEHTGLYELTNSRSSEGTSVKRFNVTVYAPLPVPVISSHFSKCLSSSEHVSVSTCVLLCSVLNVSHVTLSWLKGNSLLSSISASDSSISLSLPLEVENQDQNIYSCVINNTIRHQTTRLDINTLCRPCPEQSRRSYSIVMIIVSLWLLMFVFMSAGLCCCRRKCCQAQQEDLAKKKHELMSEYTEVTYCLHTGDLPQTAFLDVDGTHFTVPRW